MCHYISPSHKGTEPHKNRVFQSSNSWNRRKRVRSDDFRVSDFHGHVNWPTDSGVQKQWRRLYKKKNPSPKQSECIWSHLLIKIGLQNLRLNKMPGPLPSSISPLSSHSQTSTCAPPAALTHSCTLCGCRDKEAACNNPIYSCRHRVVVRIQPRSSHLYKKAV